MQDIKFKEKLKKQNQKQLEVVLIKACIDNNVELVDYLLFSEDLSNNPKIPQPHPTSSISPFGVNVLMKS